ncbi:hypothetical protein RND71_017944 [Anisodus tanguticus]|uniref:Uncharacterized protein n=1 Tax=Anisodus tanguticus TaxID=243964 RepID=A0AAE1S4P4_9SOLA|nr:hypothetical protein RND71_017944 [Anisodus tanguticus]
MYSSFSHIPHESIYVESHEIWSCDEHESSGYALCGEYDREGSGLECEPCEEFSRGYSRASPRDTSYTKRDGISVWVGGGKSRPRRKRECTFPTSRSTMSYVPYPNTNVSCSQYGYDVEGRRETSIGMGSRGNPMYQEGIDPKRRTIKTKVNVCVCSRFSLVLDDDCYTNFITPHVVEWLRIRCVMRRYPYYDEGGYWVDRKVKVFITHGEYQEEIWCEVLPMDTCHICLGYPWFQEHRIPYMQEYKYVVDKKRSFLFPPIPPKEEASASEPLPRVSGFDLS